MDDKISPELKLAMDADGYMPYSSLYLGYNASDDSWMLIIRHSGDIDDLEGDILNSCVYLLGGYAIVNVYSYNIKGFRRSRGYFISIKLNITVMVRVSPMTDTYPA